VHNPYKLESHVLHRYFRHSKFASFQRQLNYFGFRKLAGKGKMAPCSYVNEATTPELDSLLRVKVRCVVMLSSSRLRTALSCLGSFLTSCFCRILDLYHLLFLRRLAEKS